MLRTVLTFFVLGITLGSGPCLASCGPLLISYVLGTERNISGSINAYFLFSLSRVLAYLALGVITFYLGRIVMESFSGYLKYIYLSGGIFIVLMGILMMLGKGYESGFCRSFHKHFLQNNLKSMILFGLLVGLLPCAPLISVFTYSSLVSKAWYHAFLYSFSFGIGTMVSPLLILIIFAGFIPKLFKQKQAISRIMSIICGLILVFLGAQLTKRGIYA